MRRGAAAEVLGLKRFAVAGYIAEHPDFELEVRESEDAALENVEEALYQAAVSGNVRAADLWLTMHGRGRSTGRTQAPVAPSAVGRDVDDFERRLDELDG